MTESGRAGRLASLAFLIIVVLAIVGLLAGYGVPVGVGALAGLILGAIAGLLGVIWLARGPGRSLQIGAMSWSSSGHGAESPPSWARVRQMTELFGIDLGPIRRVVPVLAEAEAGGYTAQLVAVELREAGLALWVDVRARPGYPAPTFMAEVTLRDEIGTTYRAAGQGSGGGADRLRYHVVGVPALPITARSLEVRMERLLEPFPDGRAPVEGPWAFSVVIPE